MAECTWPRDAAAKGIGSNDLKLDCQDGPNDVDIARYNSRDMNRDQGDGNGVSMGFEESKSPPFANSAYNWRYPERVEILLPHPSEAYEYL